MKNFVHYPQKRFKQNSLDFGFWILDFYIKKNEQTYLKTIKDNIFNRIQDCRILLIS